MCTLNPAKYRKTSLSMLWYTCMPVRTKSCWQIAFLFVAETTCVTLLVSLLTIQYLQNYSANWEVGQKIFALRAKEIHFSVENPIGYMLGKEAG